MLDVWNKDVWANTLLLVFVQNIIKHIGFISGDWLYPKEMEFHHRDSGEKTDNVSDMMRIVSQEEVIQEVSKCDVICRNCHRLRLEIAKVA